jgi:hypothetical protein
MPNRYSAGRLLQCATGYPKPVVGDAFVPARLPSRTDEYDAGYYEERSS